MCNNCFEEEIENFLERKEWLQFDILLTKKLINNSISYLEFSSDGQRHKDDGAYIYQCNSCNQKWHLKEPEDHLGGFFLKGNE